MVVRDYMDHDFMIIDPETSFKKALGIRSEIGISTFIVVNEKHYIKGIITEYDLLNASPSGVTSLSKWELAYLLDRFTVKEIMTEQVITISSDSDIVEAAVLMLKNRISGLPVVDHSNKVVGIVTIHAILQLFIEQATGLLNQSPEESFCCLSP